MAKQRLKSRSFIIVLILTAFLITPIPCLFAQNAVECGNTELCGELVVNTPDSLIFDFSKCRDSRGRVDNGLVIRVDTLANRKVFRCQIAVELNEAQISNFIPGFYRLVATVDYSGSEQSNESFYIEGANSGGNFGPCDSTNIRNYLVVVPDENQLADGDTILVRDAGMFFLNSGETIFFKHYQLLVDPTVTPNPTHADSMFINGSGFDGPESAHLLQLKLLRTEGSDELQLTKTAQKDSVMPGESLGYTLNLTNTSVDTIFDIHLWDALPDSVAYISGSATIQQPELSAGADSLFWNFEFLEPNANIRINYQVSVSDKFEINSSPVTLTNTSQVRSECGTDTARAQVTVVPPGRNCDLALSKTASVQSVTPGDEFEYTLRVINQADAPAMNITLTDTLPAFVTPIDWPGSINGNILQTGIDFLDLGKDTTITFRAKVAEVLPNTLSKLSNRSGVAADCDFDLGNNFAIVTVTVARPNICDLSLTKTSNADTVRAGDEIVYSLRIFNQGPDTAFDLALSDTLPAFVTALDWPGTRTDNVLTLAIDSLASQQDTTITFMAKLADVLPDSVSELVNRSGISSDCDANADNNLATKTIIVPPPLCDLSLSKTADVDSVQGGDEFNYRLTIKNLGPETVSAITLEDTLPAFVTALDWSGSQANNVLTLTIDSLSAQQDTTIVLAVKLADALPDSVSELVNRSGIASDCDVNADNNLATKTIIVPPRLCDLSLSKTADVDNIQAGDEVAYRLTVTNLGPKTAFAVTLTDSLPALVTPLDWPGTRTGNVLTLVIDSLAPQENTTISFSAKIADILPDSVSFLINRSRITADCDQSVLNNFASDTLHVFHSEGCDLFLTKTASVDSVRAGDAFEYTLTITNRGQDAALDVTLTDTLPAFIEALDWPGTEADNILELLVGDIAPAQNKTITFMAKVADSLPDTVSQFVNKSFVAAPCDSSGAKNVASLTIFVKPPSIVCDLTLEKSASVSNVQPNQDFSYTMTIRNLGRDVARDITLTDTLPAYVQPVDWPGRVRGNILTLQIPSLAQDTTIVFRAKVAATLPDTLVELVNRSGITAECDRDLTNNFSSASVVPPPVGEDCIVLNVNVFRPESAELRIEFEISQPGHVRMDLHDISGYVVTNLVDADFNAGRHTISWNGRAGLNQAGLEVGSGVYIIIFRSDAPPFSCIEKVILVR